MATYTAACGSGLRAATTVFFSLTLVWAGFAAWSHAGGIRRECLNEFQLEQTAARHLLDTHCADPRFAQAAECVVGHFKLARDPEHYITDCAARDLQKHLGELVNPVTALVIWQDVTGLSSRFLTVLCFVTVVMLWLNRSAVSSAVQSYERVLQAYRAHLPMVDDPAKKTN